MEKTQAWLNDNRQVFGDIVQAEKGFIVNCLYCETSLKSPRIVHLEQHLLNSHHINYSSVLPTEKLSRKKVFERNHMLASFDCLRISTQQSENDKEQLECVFCLTKFDISADLYQVKRHLVTPKHKSKLQSPEQNAQKRKLKLSTKIVHKHPKMRISDQKCASSQYGCAENELYCDTCKLLFLPSSPTTYSKNVADHLKSDTHEHAVLKAAKKLKMKEQLETMSPESKSILAKHNESGQRRRLDTPPKKICHRTISDEDCDIALQAIQEIATVGFKSCRSTLKPLIRYRIHRDISDTTLWKRALPKATKGK